MMETKIMVMDVQRLVKLKLTGNVLQLQIQVSAQHCVQLDYIFQNNSAILKVLDVAIYVCYSLDINALLDLFQSDRQFCQILLVIRSVAMDGFLDLKFVTLEVQIQAK